MSGSLSVRDRGQLIRALALPHLDGTQSVLVNPSAAATNTLERVYRRAARVAILTGVLDTSQTA